MKLMRLAMCMAVFALVGGRAIAEDVDVQALQSKMAAQEAFLNDLEAKMHGAGCEGPAAPEGITSLRKNAVVTIGGFFNTRYYVKRSTLKSSLQNSDVLGAAGDPRRVISKGRMTDSTLGDTAIQVKIDVNEHFDAYVQLNMKDSGRPHGRGQTGPAQQYWMRWKDICNTGFGLVVGRDNLKFGGIQSYGFWDSYNNGFDDAPGDAFAGWGGTPTDIWGIMPGANSTQFGEGMFSHESPVIPVHTNWNNSRTLQVTPYWENQDGSFKAEVSWFQLMEYTHWNRDHMDRAGFNRRTSQNYGMGSFSGRITWKPVEGLHIKASIMNQHANNGSGKWNHYRTNPITGELVWFNGFDNAAGRPMDISNNNFATNLAFEYRPCFLSKVKVFASWSHGWNENWIKNQDSDAVNFGLGVDLTDKLTWYATGDYIRTKNDQGEIWHKATGWAGETGLMFTLPYGANFQVAYRHDSFKYQARNGVTHSKYKSDMFVMHAGFNF